MIKGAAVTTSKESLPSPSAATGGAEGDVEGTKQASVPFVTLPAKLTNADEATSQSVVML